MTTVSYIKCAILAALVAGTLTIGLWPSTLVLAGLWIVLRLPRAWFWFGPGSRQRIAEVHKADPEFGERLLWWQR